MAGAARPTNFLVKAVRRHCLGGKGERVVEEQAPASGRGPSERLKWSKLWAGLGVGLAILAGFLLNAGELYVSITFWALAAVLIVVRSALANEIRKQRRAHPCERCGHQGDTEPFAGREPYTLDPPRRLCFECRWAHMDLLDNLDLYQGIELLGPDSPLYRSAIENFGENAVQALALLDLAKADFSRARRVLTEEGWQQWKPWLVAQLKLREERDRVGDDE